MLTEIFFVFEVSATQLKASYNVTTGYVTTYKTRFRLRACEQLG